jgi:hypothetical protein
MGFGKFLISSDTLYQIRDGKRYLAQKTLEEVLDEIAECQGGYSHCRGGLILIDTVTGAKRLITSVNGVTTNSAIT